MIHKIKGFSVGNEANAGIFLEFPCFFDNPMDVGNLTSDFSAFRWVYLSFSPLP